MPGYRKILILSFLVIISVFILADLAFAQRELEVPIPGLETTTLPALPDYIVAIYNFALMIIGIICFVTLIYGGFRYLTSAGKPAAMADARDQMSSALLGLIILFSSYLILRTINPELVILGDTGVGGIGEVITPRIIIYEDINHGGTGYELAGSVSNLADIGWDNRISSIEFPLEEGIEIRAYKNPGYEGERCVLTRGASNIGGTCGDVSWDDEISSIEFIQKGLPFALVGNAEIGTYPHENFSCPTNGGGSIMENVSNRWAEPDTKVFLNVHEFPHGHQGGFGAARLWVNDAYVRGDDNTLQSRIGCADHTSLFFGDIKTQVDYLFTEAIETPNIETGTYVHKDFLCGTDRGVSQVNIDPKWASPETKVFVNVHEFLHGHSGGFGDARFWVNDAFVRDDNTLQVGIGCECLTCLFPITVNVDYLLIKGTEGAGTYVHENFSCPNSSGGSQVTIDPKWVSENTKVFVNVHEFPHGHSGGFDDARLWVNDAYVRGDDSTLRTRIGCDGYSGGISVRVDYFLVKTDVYY
jgi:hypothetical protein